MSLAAIEATPLAEPDFAPIHDPRISGDLRRAMIFTAIAILLRLVAMCIVPLIPEEAYYWMYGQNPQLSYYDHPPMVAWVIRAGTFFLGDTEAGVRLCGALLSIASSLLMYRFARLWFDARTALASAVFILILPVYFGIGFVAPMDSVLCFFWLACLFAVSLAFKRNEGRWWYLAGAALGGALLSKYSALFLGAGVLLTAILTRSGRRQLRTVNPYLGGLLAVAIFSPVLIWNAHHHWASFRFQFVERYAGDRFNLRTPLLFVGLQLLVLTPALLAAAGWKVQRLLRRNRPRALRDCFAILCAAPGLLAAAWTSLRSDVHVNWTAPLCLSLIPAACALALAHDRLLHRRAAVNDPRQLIHHRWQWLSAFARTASGSAIICGAFIVYLMLLQPHLRIFTAFGPWSDLAMVIEEHEDRIEADTGREPRIVADGKYRLASVLAFYRIPIEDEAHEVIDYTTSQWLFGLEGLGYPYWSMPSDWVGSDVIYVSDSEDFGDVARWFESFGVVPDPRLTGAGKDYHVAIGRQLRATPKPAEEEAATMRHEGRGALD